MKASMIALAFAGAVLTLAADGQALTASEPVFQMDYSNPGLSPSQWTLTLRPDGSGHFRSAMGKPPDNGAETMAQPAVDRDIQLSVAYAGRVFEVAGRHQWFNEPCESHLKVAFQGWKTLSYSGPQGNGSCTFNYSKDKEIEALGNSLEGVAETILTGARLELLLVHDPLGLDAEMQVPIRGCERRPGSANGCDSRDSATVGGG
ncbi:MAG: hypothetical protein ACP5E2_02480 [Terracidiphilus sp.]